MMASIDPDDLGHFGYEVLYAMAVCGPSNGQAIRKELETRYEYADSSRLYNHLSELNDLGVVKKRPSVRSAREKVFELTEAGRAFVTNDAEYRQSVATRMRSEAVEA